MAAMTESLQRKPFVSEGPDEPMTRIVPIPTPQIQMSAPSPGEPMEITTPTNASAPTLSNERDVKPEVNGNVNGNANGDRSKDSSPTNQSSTHSMTMAAPPAAAAAAVHQPKIVQTAFIHKLYNMLEDQGIQHLISWSPTAESFVMSPTADFSKVLAQYFKHTNISSFVRQLNMYGFHKVSDVFHTGNPETALWEFKHGNGNFKRGDLVGLREIKRRASRHALVHREFSNQKPGAPTPGAPVEPIPMAPDSSDPRLSGVEHTLYELGARLQRSEETQHYMQVKQQAAMETLARVLHFSGEMSRAILGVVPSDNPVHRDIVSLQGEIQRQADILRTIDEPPEPPYSSRGQYFANVDNAPVSPRQMPQDDPRRNTLTVPQSGRGNNFYRPPVPSGLSISTRRPFGSFGASTSQTSPNSLRGVLPPPPPPPGPHPLATVEAPPGSLARRHTSADIRAHGWQPSNNPFPSSGPPSSPWPSSPSRVAPEDQRIRDSLSSYSLQAASQPHVRSRPATPPAPFTNGVNSSAGNETFGSWSFSAATRGDRLAVRDTSAPPTRRGSMAHILNPSDTAEREDEDEDARGDDDRKRKRLQ